jgi:hypothetical protein
MRYLFETRNYLFLTYMFTLYCQYLPVFKIYKSCNKVKIQYRYGNPLYFHQVIMIKEFFPLAAFFVFWGCKARESSPGSPKKIVPASAASGVTAPNYDRCKKQVALSRLEYAKKWPGMSLIEKQKAFTTALTEVILPQWTGTQWNFYGTTEIPRQGTIACGYFVTTTLRDAGIGLARTKLAQCASEQMICTLLQAKYIQRFSNVSMDKFLAAIRQQGYGLYITGLDSHTGFLYNDGEEIYFIHANYTGTRCVIKEKAAGSVVLAASKYRITGKISADEKVLNRWAEI